MDTICLFQCSLEVSLEKEREGHWASLKATTEGEGATASEIPLRGPVADQLSSEELEELKRKISETHKEVSQLQLIAVRPL